ncbi:hypothetical protein [Cupriavidus basilensis]|uniref:Uncharacterized protein n=1 Tax=Cupriavidus basilensis TaxID=68895 RepID=A0A7M2H2B4_9BURK|nr:hypothetical protein [Cupriavidus basilensis]QOT78695.1 hypothetical protein F7R26_011310 [Cupriavidus basilensis]
MEDDDADLPLGQEVERFLLAAAPPAPVGGADEHAAFAQHMDSTGYQWEPAQDSEGEYEDAETRINFGCFQAGRAQSAPLTNEGGSEPVAEVVPCYTPSGRRVALNSEHQSLPIGTKLYATPAPSASPAAQEIIADFLERTGQYVTNDASREAALAEARAEGFAAGKAALQSSAIAQGCTRSHPHENMGAECAQKTIEARAANTRAQPSAKAQQVGVAEYCASCDDGLCQKGHGAQPSAKALTDAMRVLRQFNALITEREQELGGLSKEMQEIADQARALLAAEQPGEDVRDAVNRLSITASSAEIAPAARVVQASRLLQLERLARALNTDAKTHPLQPLARWVKFGPEAAFLASLSKPQQDQ